VNWKASFLVNHFGYNGKVAIFDEAVMAEIDFKNNYSKICCIAKFGIIMLG